MNQKTHQDTLLVFQQESYQSQIYKTVRTLTNLLPALEVLMATLALNTNTDDTKQVGKISLINQSAYTEKLMSSMFAELHHLKRVLDNFRTESTLWNYETWTQCAEGTLGNNFALYLN